MSSVEGIDHDLLYDEDENNRIIDTEHVRDCSSSYERDQRHGALFKLLAGTVSARSLVRPFLDVLFRSHNERRRKRVSCV